MMRPEGGRTALGASPCGPLKQSPVPARSPHVPVTPPLLPLLLRPSTRLLHPPPPPCPVPTRVSRRTGTGPRIFLLPTHPYVVSNHPRVLITQPMSTLAKIPSTSSARHTSPTSYRDNRESERESLPCLYTYPKTRMASLRLIATMDVPDHNFIARVHFRGTHGS